MKTRNLTIAIDVIGDRFTDRAIARALDAAITHAMYEDIGGAELLTKKRCPSFVVGYGAPVRPANSCRAELHLQCPKCKGTDISAECRTWARFKRDVPDSFDDEDLPSAVLIDGERICHHCNHIWEERES